MHIKTLWFSNTATQRHWLWPHVCFAVVVPSDPFGPAGAVVRPAGRRGPLCLRTLFLRRAPAEAAQRQVCHPHEGRLLLGEWAAGGDQFKLVVLNWWSLRTNIHFASWSQWELKTRTQFLIPILFDDHRARLEFVFSNAGVRFHHFNTTQIFRQTQSSSPTAINVQWSDC